MWKLLMSATFVHKDIHSNLESWAGHINRDRHLPLIHHIPTIDHKTVSFSHIFSTFVVDFLMMAIKTGKGGSLSQFWFAFLW